VGRWESSQSKDGDVLRLSGFPLFAGGGRAFERKVVCCNDDADR
jgi:hypothetical protein